MYGLPSQYLPFFLHIYGDIEEHREGKGHQLFYRVSHKKTKGQYFADCEKGKRKEEMFFIRE